MTHPRRWIPALLLAAACSSDPAAPSPALDAALSDDVSSDRGSVADLTDLGMPTDAPVALDVPDVLDAPVALDAPDALDAPVDVAASPYPDGPYGNRMGSVLANLTWEGYVNPTGEVISNTLPYTTTSLQALRGSRRGYAMVHVSEFL